MPFDNILKNIRNIIILDDMEKQAFIDILEFKVYSKKEFIFKEGDFCQTVYYINKGYSRIYYNLDGEETTTEFFSFDDWFCNFSSYLTRSPSSFNFQAISDVEIIELDLKKVEALYDRYPRMERIGRVLVEQVLMYISNEKRYEYMPPEERYENLLKDRPDWIQNIPQKYIASYFKIQPESLSRIKSRIYSIN